MLWKDAGAWARGRLQVYASTCTLMFFPDADRGRFACRISLRNKKIHISLSVAPVVYGILCRNSGQLPGMTRRSACLACLVGSEATEICVEFRDRRFLSAMSENIKQGGRMVEKIQSPKPPNPFCNRL